MDTNSMIALLSLLVYGTVEVLQRKFKFVVDPKVLGAIIAVVSSALNAGVAAANGDDAAFAAIFGAVLPSGIHGLLKHWLPKKV